jgi:hypothetical protein
VWRTNEHVAIRYLDALFFLDSLLIPDELCQQLSVSVILAERGCQPEFGPGLRERAGS